MSRTITAIATPTGSGGLAVIRISGPDTLFILKKIFKPKYHHSQSFELKHRYATLGELHDPQTNEKIDEVIVTYFRGPRSYTGEDLAEVSCHGGSAVSNAVLQAILSCGAEPAQPGEFTKRAFLNGRIDLSQAESIASLTAAATQTERKLALRNLDGFLSQHINSIRRSIQHILANMELMLDFPEEDIDFSGIQEYPELHQVEGTIKDLLEAGRRGERIKSGFRMVLTGHVNVGKSKIFNRLIGRNKAIVTSEPGTTRDALEEQWMSVDLSVTIVDTAGFRNTDSDAERQAIQVSKNYIRDADLILFVIDSTNPEMEENLREIRKVHDKPLLVLWNKIDTGPLPDDTQNSLLSKVISGDVLIPVSAKTGEGFNVLRRKILLFIDKHIGKVENNVVMLTIRQNYLLESALADIRKVREDLEKSAPLECVVPDIRSAYNKLGEIIGEHIAPDVLDVIFKQFCIGK